MLLGIVLVLAVLLIVANFYLGDIVKSAVNKAGPGLLNVPITLDKAEIHLLRGSVQLKNLVIGNPRGFKTPYLFKLGELFIKVDVGSVFKNTVVIEKVLISAPEINYEKGLLTSNIDTLLKSLGGEETNAPPAAEEKKPAPAPAEKEGGKKVVINDFLLENGKVRVSLTATQGVGLPVPLPTIHMTDIGKETGGTSWKDVIKKVLRTVAGSVSQVGAKSVELIGKGVEKTGELAKEAGKATVEGAKDVGHAATEGAKKVGSAVGEGAGKIFQGAKDLLPGGEPQK